MRVRIYTDGACSGNPGPGGWAIVWNTDLTSKPYSGGETNTTNNRMELTAMLRCLEKIAKADKRNTYEVYSDSAYVVNAINNRWLQQWQARGWKTKTGDEIKNRDLWEQVVESLNAIAHNGQSVKVIKIKGHAGNTFNELVDKIAKEESVKASQA